MGQKHAISIFAGVLLWSAAVCRAATYSAGHGDFGVAYEEDGGWYVHYHFDAGTVLDGHPIGSGLPDEAYEFEPAAIRIEVPFSASLVLASSVSYLGNTPGSRVWLLSQNSVAGQPYFGLATEELSGADWSGPIRFELTAFSGPGNFAMWSTGTFGAANVKFQTNNGISSADFETLPTGTHAHYNWGFTAPGTYEATVTVSATHKEDGFQTSTKTIVFDVVPEPSTGLLGLAGAAALVGRRRRFIS